MSALGRARDDLVAAEQLCATGHGAQAVAGAFDAARHAAEAALLTVGETGATSSAVVSGFVARVVRERGCDAKAGRLLRSLHNRGLLADHSCDPVPPDEAAAAVRDATAVVDGVEEWLAAPVRTPHGPTPRHTTPVPAKAPRRRR